MSEYNALPLLVAPKTVHTVYIKKHQNFSNQKSASDSDSEEDSDNTIFCMNLPLDVTEDNIRDICKALGDVHLDYFERLGPRHGLIHLLDESSAKRMLSKAKKLNKKTQISWQKYGPRGVEGYIAKHKSKFLPEDELQKMADDYMEMFAKQEEIELEEAQAAANYIDEDGFQLVVNKNRKRLADMPAPTSEPKKKKSLEKDDFYKFQLRQQRKQEMTDLLQRYQEDKAKVEELKKQKKFRPY